MGTFSDERNYDKTMSILTQQEILKEIKRGNIRIRPFDPGCVGPASVDLHLGKEFRVFKKGHNVLEISESLNYEQVTEKVRVRDRLMLMPQETVLGITLESIRLAPDICGWLEGRSRFARLGLLVHISASFMQPGISNKQCLEISNFSPIPIYLKPGLPICQFVFQRTVGRASYRGIFRNQNERNF
ncbi:MAG: dCTP deaminase [Acidobacteriota bacterium]